MILCFSHRNHLFFHGERKEFGLKDSSAVKLDHNSHWMKDHGLLFKEYVNLITVGQNDHSSSSWQIDIWIFSPLIAPQSPYNLPCSPQAVGILLIVYAGICGSPSFLLARRLYRTLLLPFWWRLPLPQSCNLIAEYSASWFLTLKRLVYVLPMLSHDRVVFCQSAKRV